MLISKFFQSQISKFIDRSCVSLEAQIESLIVPSRKHEVLVEDPLAQNFFSLSSVGFLIVLLPCFPNSSKKRWACFGSYRMIK